MGWIEAHPYRAGVGSVRSDIEVEEPAGHKGKYITPAGQNRKNKDKLRLLRNGREIT